MCVDSDSDVEEDKEAVQKKKKKKYSVNSAKSRGPMAHPYL